MLQLQSISKSFIAGTRDCRAAVRVLDEVSFTVSAGQVVLVGGAAGAGKSTLLRCAAGLLRPDAGARYCLHDSHDTIHYWPGPHDWRRAGVRALAQPCAVHLFDEPSIDAFAGARAELSALLRRLTIARHAVMIATSLPLREFATLVPRHARYYNLEEGRLRAVAVCMPRATSMLAERAEQRAAIFG
jgi:ABC-type sulfate/molybdate transport systems ATPase subunit